MGGNIFKGKTASIRKENIMPTVELYFQELGRLFPHKKDMFNLKKMKFVGSVLKKDLSGDIDFAIDISSIVDKSFSEKSIAKWGLNKEEVVKQFQAYKKRARTATDAELMIRAMMKGIVTKINAYAEHIHCDDKKVGIGGIFGLYPQYNEQGEELGTGVQIDWMIGDIDLLEFSYHSESYEGNVKGLHRTQLFLAMFNHYGYTFSHTKGLMDKETGEKIATKPKDIVPYLEDAMDIKLGKSTINNFFKLVKTLDKIPKKDKDDILNIFFKIMSHTRADIPLDLQEDWKRLNKKFKYETKFLPDSSLLKESTKFKFFIENICESTQVIFPFYKYNKNKDLKNLQDIGKKHNLVVDSTWDSSNPHDYKIKGNQENIESFLTDIGYKNLINQI